MSARERSARAASLALFLGCACGWHAGLSGPEGARSVGVEAVQRDGKVLERGLEPELTDALSEAVVDWVDLPLVRSARADLVVRSEILEYRRRGGVRTPENELIETAVFVRARAELYDRRLGRPVAEVQAQNWSGFALDDPSNEEAARSRALRTVAVTLILKLFESRAEEASPSDLPGRESLTPQER